MGLEGLKSNTQRLTALLAIAALSVLAMIGCGGQVNTSFAPAPVSSAQALSIDSIVNAEIAKNNVPGVQLAISRGGRLIYSKAYGFSDLTIRAPMTTVSTMRIGSVSKQFTTAAIMLLQQDGLLSIDDKVSRWIPELTFGDRITLRQLGNQDSGMPGDDIVAFGTPTGVGVTITQASELARLNDLYATGKLSAPGIRFEYANVNFYLLSIVIERASKMDLPTFEQNRIFSVLGMDATYSTEHRADARLATGYLRNLGTDPWGTYPELTYGLLFGAGNLISTAEDLVRWDNGLATLLSPQSIQTYLTVPVLPNNSPTSYAFGINSYRGSRSHNGETLGFHAFNIVYADGIAIIMLGNSRECGLSFFIPENLATVIHDKIAPPADYPTTFPSPPPPTPSPSQPPFFIPPSTNFPCT